MSSVNLPINKATVDALFSFVESAVPSWAPVLKLVNGLLDNVLPASHPYKATFAANAPVKMSSADLKAWVDQAFAFVESAVAGTIWLPPVLSGINLVVDQVGLPALTAWLQSLGILTA